MKKIITIASLLCCTFAAKAQKPQLDISNTTGTPMNMALFANGHPMTTCGVTGNTPQIALSATVTPYNVSAGTLASLPTWLNPTVPFPATNLTEMSLFVTVGGNVYAEHILFCGMGSSTRTLTFTGMFTCSMSVSVIGPKYIISLY